MTETHITISEETDSERAGRALGAAIRQAFRGTAADAVAVFASAQHDYAALLAGLAEEAGRETIVGASSAGEFTQRSRREGSVCAMGLRSDSMLFSVGLG